MRGQGGTGLRMKGGVLVTPLGTWWDHLVTLFGTWRIMLVLGLGPWRIILVLGLGPWQCHPCHWSGAMAVSPLSPDLEGAWCCHQFGVIVVSSLITELDTWCVWVGSGLGMWWYHPSPWAGNIVASSFCDWFGVMAVSPSWRHSSIILITRFRMWWCGLCHSAGHMILLFTHCVGDMVVSFLSLGWGCGGIFLVTEDVVVSCLGLGA